jgi:hypothetical protein
MKLGTSWWQLLASVFAVTLVYGITAVHGGAAIAPSWKPNRCGRQASIAEVSLVQDGRWTVELGGATSEHVDVAMHVPAPPGNHEQLFGHSAAAPGATVILQIALRAADGRELEVHGGKLQDWGLSGAVEGEPLYYDWVFDLKGKGEGPFTLEVNVSQSDATLKGSRLVITFVDEHCIVSRNRHSEQWPTGIPIARLLTTRSSGRTRASCRLLKNRKRLAARRAAERVRWPD